jgi:hypothetical protein
MRPPSKQQRNDALDPIWELIPKCERYLIEGKRYVMVGKDGSGHLVTLADYAEGKGV